MHSDIIGLKTSTVSPHQRALASFEALFTGPTKRAPVLLSGALSGLTVRQFTSGAVEVCRDHTPLLRVAPARKDTPISEHIAERLSSECGVGWVDGDDEDFAVVRGLLGVTIEQANNIAQFIQPAAL